jgi:hypothetical protein
MKKQSQGLGALQAVRTAAVIRLRGDAAVNMESVQSASVRAADARARLDELGRQRRELCLRKLQLAAASMPIELWRFADAADAALVVQCAVQRAELGRLSAVVEQASESLQSAQAALHAAWLQREQLQGVIDRRQNIINRKRGRQE